jgi:hypothetical protein
MATLYWNGAVDNDWATLGNWWLDSGFTSQAGALPSTTDNVVLSGSCTSNIGSTPTVLNITITGTLNISINVTDMATFNSGGTSNLSATITGSVTFNNSSIQGGTIVGNVTLNDDAANYSEIIGDATFYDRAIQGSTITGNAVFNDESRSTGGSISGTATYNDTSYNSVGLSGGAVTFYDYSYHRGTGGSANLTFYDYSYSDGGSTNSGTVTFNDNSRYIGGGIGGNSDVNSTFNDNSILQGNPSIGQATFNDTSRASFDGSGAYDLELTFNDRSYGSGAATLVTINDGPIATNIIDSLGGGQPQFTFNFTRAQLGINGSSILGVL